MYLEVSGCGDGVEEHGDAKPFVFGFVDRIHDHPCWNPHDVSSLDLVRFPVLLVKQGYGPTAYNMIAVRTETQ